MTRTQRLAHREQTQVKQLRWQNIHSGLCYDLIKLIISFTPVSSLHFWLTVSKWTRSEAIKTVQTRSWETWRECFISNLSPLGQHRCVSCDMMIDNDRICASCAENYPFLDTLTKFYARFTTKKGENRERKIDIQKHWSPRTNADKYYIKCGDQITYSYIHPVYCNGEFYYSDENATDRCMWEYLDFTLERNDSEWVAQWVDHRIYSSESDDHDDNEDCVTNYCRQCLYNEASKLFKHPVQLRLAGEFCELAYHGSQFSSPIVNI